MTPPPLRIRNGRKILKKDPAIQLQKRDPPPFPNPTLHQTLYVPLFPFPLTTTGVASPITGAISSQQPPPTPTGSEPGAYLLVDIEGVGFGGDV